MTLSPYPAYKDSGLPWLGQVPEHWEEKRGKYFFREVDERSTTGEEELLSISHTTGVTPRSQKNVTMFKAESYVGHKLAMPNDIVINTMWAWMAALGVSRHTGIVSPSYGVYRPHNEQDFVPEYVDYLLRTPPMKWEYICRSTGIRSSRLRLYPDKFLDIAFPCPPQEEQECMVTFLKAKEARIRHLIRNKRRLIALLNEQKQAVINQAVTRGLDPNAPMKPTGIDWMPEIPVHWEAKRIKTVTKILRGQFSHRPRNDPSMYDGKFPFIQTGDVARAGKFIVDYNQTLNEKGFAVSKQFPRGTLVMTIAANIGDVAILDFDACFPDSIVGFVPENGIMLDFLFYSFSAMKSELMKKAPVNTQGNLNIERVGAIPIAIPEMVTQKAVVSAVESETEKINQTIDRAECEIKFIQEYRERLIADVVTGKLDVREVAVAMPEADEALEELEEDNGDDLLEEEMEPEEVEE